MQNDTSKGCGTSEFTQRHWARMQIPRQDGDFVFAPECGAMAKNRPDVKKFGSNLNISEVDAEPSCRCRRSKTRNVDLSSR